MGTTLAPSDGDAGKAFNIWDVALDGLEFIASPQAAGNPPQDELTLIWRETHSRSGSYYESAAPKYIYVGAHAAYDDTVISRDAVVVLVGSGCDRRWRRLRHGAR